MDARPDWLASLARDYAAAEVTRDDHEPAIEIPILDGPDNSGARACCGGRRYHTDDCPEGPSVEEVLS